MELLQNQLKAQNLEENQTTDDAIENKESRSAKMQEILRVESDKIDRWTKQMERMDEKLIEMLLQNGEQKEMIENLEKLKVSIDENNSLIDSAMFNCNLIEKSIDSLEEMLEEARETSYDGTYLWRIEKLTQKLSEIVELRNETNENN